MKVKPKHAKSKGWREKFEAGKENWDGSIITKREEAIGNYHLDLINNLEFNPTDYVELDVGKIEKILNQDVPYLESSSNKIDRVHASIQRANNKTYANCIVKAFDKGEITK